MGTIPGVASGYATGPAAVIGRQPTQPAKRTNHMFAGPDHSVVHPGIFPHNPEAKALASSEEWVLFDWQSGWGTDEFEDTVADEDVFPEPWSWADDRYEARDIIIDQLALLAEAREQGTTLLRNGYQLGEHGEWAKVTNFELGTRVPLIIALPGQPASTRGTISSALVEHLDIYPTLVDVAGLPPPTDPAGDASS